MGSLASLTPAHFDGLDGCHVWRHEWSDAPTPSECSRARLWDLRRSPTTGGSIVVAKKPSGLWRIARCACPWAAPTVSAGLKIGPSIALMASLCHITNEPTIRFNLDRWAASKWCHVAVDIGIRNFSISICKLIFISISKAINRVSIRN